jgi:hypothetical protein
MKKHLSALAVSMALVALSAPAAQADTPGCVSKRELDHVHTGMAMSRVHRIFDTDGRLVAGLGRMSIRKYRPCPRHSLVRVTYRGGHVSAKVALWQVG